MVEGVQVTWVRELMSSDGKEWNIELLSKLFWQKDVDDIKRIPISQVGSKDRIVWHFNNKGVYTVQSAYQKLQSADRMRDQQV